LALWSQNYGSSSGFVWCFKCSFFLGLWVVGIEILMGEGFGWGAPESFRDGRAGQAPQLLSALFYF
jgi:hypothetical protein